MWYILKIYFELRLVWRSRLMVKYPLCPLYLCTIWRGVLASVPCTLTSFEILYLLGQRNCLFKTLSLSLLPPWIPKIFLHLMNRISGYHTLRINLWLSSLVVWIIINTLLTFTPMSTVDYSFKNFRHIKKVIRLPDVITKIFSPNRKSLSMTL